MGYCADCGNTHPESSPATKAWADQFDAEFRDTARALYSEALAAQGRTVAISEEGMQALDALFQIGGDAMVIALSLHGALKKAER